MQHLRAICLLVLALLAGCGTQRRAAAPVVSPGDALAPGKDQVWQLVALRGREVSRTSNVITLVVNPEAGLASGNGPCNSYGASAQLKYTATMPDGDHYAVKFSNLTSTDTRCPDSELGAEARHTALLASADAMVLTATTLTLLCRDKEVLRYELR